MSLHTTSGTEVRISEAEYAELKREEVAMEAAKMRRKFRQTAALKVKSDRQRKESELDKILGRNPSPTSSGSAEGSDFANLASVADSSKAAGGEGEDELILRQIRLLIAQYEGAQGKTDKMATGDMVLEKGEGESSEQNQAIENFTATNNDKKEPTEPTSSSTSHPGMAMSTASAAAHDVTMKAKKALQRQRDAEESRRRRRELMQKRIAESKRLKTLQDKQRQQQEEEGRRRDAERKAMAARSREAEQQKRRKQEHEKRLQRIAQENARRKALRGLEEALAKAKENTESGALHAILGAAEDQTKDIRERAKVKDTAQGVVEAIFKVAYDKAENAKSAGYANAKTLQQRSIDLDLASQIVRVAAGLVTTAFPSILLTAGIVPCLSPLNAPSSFAWIEELCCTEDFLSILYPQLIMDYDRLYLPDSFSSSPPSSLSHGATFSTFTSSSVPLIRLLTALLIRASLHIDDLMGTPGKAKENDKGPGNSTPPTLNQIRARVVLTLEEWMGVKIDIGDGERVHHTPNTPIATEQSETPEPAVPLACLFDLFDAVKACKVAGVASAQTSTVICANQLLNKMGDKRRRLGTRGTECLKALTGEAVLWLARIKKEEKEKMKNAASALELRAQMKAKVVQLRQQEKEEQKKQKQVYSGI